MAMTPEQQKAIALASARLRLQSTESPTVQQTDINGPSVEAPNAAARAGRGMMDLYQGIKQLGLSAKDQFTGGNEADNYTKQVGQEIAAYEKGRGKDAGFDWMRLAGNIATPAVLLPGGVGATTGMRVATGAAMGAGQAGLMFTPEGESKGAQIASGAVAGGLVPLAVEGVTRGVRNVLNKGGETVSNVVRSGIDESEVTNALSQSLKESGIDFNKMGKQAQQALKAEASAQLNASGALDNVSLERIAKAKILDPRLQLTRGQATRSPMDWQKEQDLRGIRDVGDELKTRFGEQGRILAEKAEVLKGENATPFQAGEKAIKAIQDKFAETGDEVSALYRAARETVGAQADVPLAPLQGRAMQALVEFDDVIPGPIKSRLQALGIDRMGPTKPSKAFTVEEAESLDKLINKRWDASNKTLTAALSELKSALRDSLDAVGSDAGTEAAKAYQLAKKSASARFDEFGQKISRAATEDVAPDRFVKKFVTNGDVRDIKGLVKTLTTGTKEQVARGNQALNSVRAAALSEIFEGNNGAIVDGMLSGAKLEKALNKIGPERLNAIFTPQQVKYLELLKGVSLDLTKPPPLSDINYSRTSTALANLLNSIGKMPGLGLVAKAGQAEVERTQRKAVESALQGSAATKSVREVMSPESQNALARKLAPYLAAPVNALVYQNQ